MTQAGNLKFDKGGNIINTSPAIIKGEDCELHMKGNFVFGEFDSPGIAYDILVDGKYAGDFTVILEKDLDKIPFKGNVGVQVNREFYGKQLPTKATKACFELFKQHNIDQILVTYDEGNRAIETSCKELGGKHINDLPLDGKLKKRAVVRVI